MNVHVGPGKNNDKTYGTMCLKTVEAGDLCLRDLDYFDLGDLQAIHEKKGVLYLTAEAEYTNLYQESCARNLQKWDVEKAYRIYSTRYGTTNGGAYIW